MSPDLRSIVIVANADSQDLSVFDFTGRGRLDERPRFVVNEPALTGKSMVLAVAPNRRVLYAGHLSGENQSSVTSIRIDPRTGDLERAGRIRVAESMSYLASDRSGRFLLGASYAGNIVTVNPIAADGSVEPSARTFATRPKAHCVLTDPSNRYVLHTSLGADLIYQQRFDAASGTLAPNDPPTYGVRAHSGPRFIVFSPRLSIAYVISELDGSILVLPFDAVTGTLQAPLQTASALPPGFSGKTWAADIHFRPDGKFLYVSERTSSTVSAFSVDAVDGTLTHLDSYPTVAQPRAFCIDPAGSVLIAAGQLSNSIQTFTIDATSGRLSPVAEFGVGKNPTWVEVVALG
jgi:6-phosphogluconolactonase